MSERTRAVLSDVFAGVVVVLLAAVALVAHLPGKIALLVVGAVLTVVSRLLARGADKDLRRQRSELLIERHLLTLCQQTFALGKVRANVMLVDAEGQLSINWSLAPNPEYRYVFDNDFSIAKGDGCCGAALLSGRTVTCDLRDPMAPNHFKDPKLRKLADYVTGVISVPLALDSRVVGVLNLDTMERSLDGFLAEETGDAARGVAQLVERELKELGIRVKGK